MTKIEILKSAIPNVNEFYTDSELGDYVENIESQNPEDIIAEFMDDIWDEEIRRCSKCGKLMKEGYCYNGGDSYYCSDECLHEDFTKEGWLQECEMNDDSYWTEWY